MQDSYGQTTSIPSFSNSTSSDVGLPSDKKAQLVRPFPGLRPFNEFDQRLFFGRTRQIGELLEHLKAYRFLAVVGVSGSGKSSLILAGLVPRLRQGFLVKAGDRWKKAVLRPGKSPIDALAEALR